MDCIKNKWLHIFAVVIWYVSKQALSNLCPLF